MNSVGRSHIYRVSFPAIVSEGKDIFYTIYNADGSVYQARTNSNVVEYGGGIFGIELTFASEGNYEIQWDIDGTNYEAGEEINIYDFTHNDDLQGIKDIVTTILDFNEGRWIIDENIFTMSFYKKDNTSLIATFALKDIVGNPSYNNVFERVRLP